MKVMLVIDSLYTGGAEISSLQLMSYLKSSGHCVKICKLQDRNPEYNPVDFDLQNDTVTLNNRALYEQIAELKEVILAFKPDIVHSVLFKSNIRVRIVKLTMAFSFLHIEHLVSCPYDRVRLKDPQINKLGFYAYKFLDKISVKKGVDSCIAITEQVKEHYVKELKIPESKIHVINRGREINKFVFNKGGIRPQLLKQLNIDEESVVLLHVGRHEYAKGHLIFLKALDEIYHMHNDVWEKIKVIFCGREGNETTAINSFLDPHQYLSANIRWLGHRNDIPELLASADLFVFPSLYEGLGGALIEAQAAALPIICSDLPVFHEVVEEHENALMFRAGDHKALAGKITYLVNDSKMQRSMGERSLLNFERKFNLEKVNEETLSFYFRKAGA